MHATAGIHRGSLGQRHAVNLGAGTNFREAAHHRVFGCDVSEIASPWVGAFVKRLGELGWAEGRNVVIDYRWAEARSERYTEIAAELANRKVDVIVTWASAPVLAVKRATTSIPIVFAAQMDPVGAGVVASLAHPGGNITGMSIQQTDTAGKRIELLREVVTQACTARRDGEFGRAGSNARNARGRDDSACART
jgi:ABC transporter substrate binding protein